MRVSTSPSSGRPYGLALVCRIWDVARATVYRRRVPVDPGRRQRPGPVGPMPDADLLERIRGVLDASPFHGEGHRKVWARLRFAGLRTSRHRVLRLMLKDGPLLSPDRIGADGAGTYPPAIKAARKQGQLARDPVHHVTKHLQQGIESDHFRLKKNMPRVGGFRSFNTARRSIQGFEAMLWLRKGFGFAGAWTVHEQNRLLGFCFGLSEVNEG